MAYDPRKRPAQPDTPKPDAFEVRRAEVRDGLSLAYLREGIGGYPLLLVHGYPETKRIWWRNVVPLVEAGYEVIVPDLRGYGDSDLSRDDAYDITIYSRDLERLVRDVCGHERIGAVGGDVGGVVLVDLLHRFPGLVDRLVFFNTVPPLVPDRLAAAGLDPGEFSGLADSPTGDYRLLQGAHPDALAARLNTEELRRGWVADMYGHRLWASPGTFSPTDVDFMTEPFGDEARLRASWAVYQLGHGRPMSEAPLLGQPVATPTLLLYGSDDHVVGDDFVHYCEAVFDERVGPLAVPGAGHFLQWERADIFNPLVARFFADLRPAAP
jgi:pimeloyl-ACP methyl ester carboxylesterase